MTPENLLISLIAFVTLACVGALRRKKNFQLCTEAERALCTKTAKGKGFIRDLNKLPRW